MFLCLFFVSWMACCIHTIGYEILELGWEKIETLLRKLRVPWRRTIRPFTLPPEPTTNGLLSGSDPGRWDVDSLPCHGLVLFALSCLELVVYLAFLFYSSSGGIRADSGQQGEFRTGCVYIQFSLQILPVSFLWPSGRTFAPGSNPRGFLCSPACLLPGLPHPILFVMLTYRSC